MTPREYLLFSERLPEPVMLVSSDGRLYAANRAARQHFGIGDEAASPLNVLDFINGEHHEFRKFLGDSQRAAERVMHVAALRGAGGETRDWRCDGGRVGIELENAPALVVLQLRRKDGMLRGFLALNEKITDLQRENRRRRQNEQALRELVKGIAAHTGRALFPELARHLAAALGTRYALVSRLERPEGGAARSLALWIDGKFADDFSYELRGTPCENVYRDGFWMQNGGASSGKAEGAMLLWAAHGYMGMVIRDGQRRPIGHVAALHDQAIGDNEYARNLLSVAASRAGAELMRMDAETALTHEKHLMTQAQQIAHVGSWSWDIPGGAMSWSDETYRIFGHPPRQFAIDYDGFVDEVHPADRARWTAAMHHAIYDRRRFDVTHRVLRPGGELRWVHQLGEVRYDEYDQPVHMLGVVHDITDSKLSQDALNGMNLELEKRIAERTRELEQERNFIATVIDTAGALVVVMDNTGRIQRFNHACEQTSGYSAAEVEGNFVWDILLSEEDIESVKNVFTSLTRGHFPNRHENKWLSKNGEARLIAWTNSAIANAAGEVSHVIGTGIDITERRDAERKLQAAKQLAERANQAKSEFLSRMSHELRTPLNSVIGFAQLLRADGEAELTAAQTEHVEEISRAGEQLLTLIDEVLDLARIESGKVSVLLEVVDLRDIVEECVMLMGALADDRGIALRVSGERDIPVYVQADRVRLKQVLINLLANAIKYNRPEGRVEIDWQGIGSSRLRIQVIDSGRGIAEEHQKRLFEPFERLGVDDGREPGSGIGLTVAKQLVELMSGEIGVTSLPGRGSTFFLDLPRAEAPAGTSATNAARPAASEAAFTLLYVEDNAANVRLVQHIMKRRPDVKVLTAPNAELGIELARIHKPELILMDINLPGMNGIEAMTRLKRQSETAKIPVLAVSAAAMASDVERGRAAGFVRYLTKPIRVDALLAAVDAALSIHLLPEQENDGQQVAD